MSRSSKIKRGITKTFKRLGLSLKKDALNKLLEIHGECGTDDQFDQILEQLSELTLSKKLATPIISLDHIQPCIDQLFNQQDQLNDENMLTPFIESAFDARRFRYKTVGKQFISIKNGSIHGNADDLTNVFIDRYQLLKQRLLRHNLFNQSSLISSSSKSKSKSKSKNDDNKNDASDDDISINKLTNTQALIGTTCKQCIFGMLSELNEGRIYIQDLDGNIEIDIDSLTTCNKTNGLFTFNCFVLCEGYMNNLTSKFQVKTLAFPPYEARRKTIKIFNNLNFLPFSKQQIMMQLESTSTDDTFVFLSNVYLDLSSTFNKLIKLFNGYSSSDTVSPTLFIFLGNFTSSKLGTSSSDMKYLASLFDKLCDLLINKYLNTLCISSSFIFIPGPNDSLIGNILPQPRLINSLFRKFNYHNNNGDINVRFQSNPFRIRFATQEIVVFRYDLLQKMRRNCCVVPDINKSTDLSEHLCKTIMDQSYLCPLPLQISPIYWNYSHSLFLYPSPHLIVLGDANDNYRWKYQDTQIVSPGNFTTSGSFVAYTPYNKFADFSIVN